MTLPLPRPEYDKVPDIFTTLQEFIDEFDSETPQSAASEREYNRLNRNSLRFLLAAALILIAAAIANHYQFPLDWSLAYGLSLFSAVLLSLYANVRVYREQPEILAGLRQPKPAILKRLGNVIGMEGKYVDKLRGYSTLTLSFVRSRLSLSLDNQRDRIEALFGLATKIGLFPAVLSAALALFVALRSAPPLLSLLLLASTALLFANHTTAHNLQASLIDMRSMLALLDRTIQEQAEG